MMITETVKPSSASLDKLAKLLASENITVRHSAGNVSASFDTQNRVLHLPVWKEMTKTLYHMLVLHEVGHAIYTPDEKWRETITAQGRSYKNFLNVIEDARIERKMKLKYPGSRRDFYDGYKSLNDRDFFGLSERDMDEMSFIDRMNTHFKLGAFFAVPFKNTIEREFIARAETVTTFDEVVALTNDVFSYAQQKNEKKEIDVMDFDLSSASKGFGENSVEYDFDDDSDDNVEDDEYNDTENSKSSSKSMSSDEDDDDSGDNVEDDEYNDTENSKSSSKSMSSDEDDGDSEENDFDDKEQIDEMVSDTMDLLEENMTALVDRMSMPAEYFTMDPVDETYTKKHVQPYKHILSVLNPLRGAHLPDHFSAFQSKNSKVISYMVKEFEVRKAADQYLRARTSKTGVINPNKLHSYTMTDDIFRRLTVLPGSKNHGLFMLVDFSGSMSPNMKATIEQLLCLVSFCRKLSIPHRVYAFQSQITKAMINYDKLAAGVPHSPFVPHKPPVDTSNKIYPAANVALLELFHEKMNTSEFRQMARHVLWFAEICAESNNYGSNKKFLFGLREGFYHQAMFSLGGTPLNDSLILCRPLIRKFRDETAAQIVNFIALTDGESQFTGRFYWSSHNTFSKKNFIATDSVTKTQHVIQQETDETTFILKSIRRELNVRCVAFRLENKVQSANKLIMDLLLETNRDSLLEKTKNNLRSSYYGAVDNVRGYDDYYVILANKSAEETSFEKLAVGKMTKSQLSRSFIKMNNNRSVSRVLLSRFIELIAK